MMRTSHPRPRPTLLVAAVLLAVPATLALAQTSPLQYPSTRRGDQVDDYHGTRVADPYRWLEDIASPETRAWIDAQNALTRSYLDAIPERVSIAGQLTRLWNYPKYAVPVRRGGRTFYFENSGLQNQPVYYVRDRLNGEARVLLDPNALSADGTVAVSTVSPTPDGTLLGYGVSASGSDWQEWKVREVATNKDLADHLKWSKFSSASWRPDGSGFYYGRYEAPKEGEALQGVNKNQKVFFINICTSQ